MPFGRRRPERVCWLLLSGCVVNAPPVAETTADGLVRVQAKQVDTVYV